MTQLPSVKRFPTQPASPWQNECLDHIVILNAAHLRRVLGEYARYYNSDRTHLALDKDAPLGRRVERHGRLTSRPVPGGLHRRYGRTRR
jgi:putative transposase